MSTVFAALGIAVAAADPYVVVWNGSATFNVYRVDGSEWTEVDVFTHYGNGPDGGLDASAAIESGRDWVERADRAATA